MLNGSLRSRILTAFISFAILFACISFITYKYINRSENLDQVKAWLLTMEVSVLDLIKQDAADLFNDSAMPFKNNQETETFLENRKNKVELVSASIDKLLSNDKVEEWKINDNLLFVDSLIDEYNSIFYELINAKRTLGSESTGLYKEFLDNGNQLLGLKGSVNISYYNRMQHLAVKYFLDPKTSYVLEINKIAGELKSRIDGTQDKAFAQQVDNYLIVFNEIVLIQYRIGQNRKDGLIGKLHNKSDYIESEFDSLSTDVSNRFVQLMWKIKLSYALVSLIAVLFTMVVGYNTALKVSTPITVLEGRTRKVIEDGYVQTEKNIDFKSLRKPTSEVASLANSFQEMYDMIQNQFKELEAGNHQLKKSEKQLMESNKMKDQFFSIISHDLKGPINTQIGFLKLMMERSNAFTPEEITILSKDMYFSMKNIMDLMENLLSWSRSASNSLKIDKKVNSINKVLNKNYELYSSTAKKKNIQLELLAEENLFSVFDFNSIDCVIRNLISNAMKFTSDDGTGVIRIEASKVKDEVKIVISDNGVGMSKENLDKLMNPEVQYSTKGTSKEKGVGLGMLLVQDFVMRNNGRLVVESMEGKGTQCILRLSFQPEYVEMQTPELA
ncbi:HAMP domain-containing histidine kinase [Flammeovirga sp. MY04]|uniref:sensor histidine kinase n=1 Tax=Flammeovirga sp. MY04 TaxID=1191459 RepID=UPI000806168B|nr:HAMP domain-containing sensor histidine kinase [Flammeovirga sp. MY04]ANQ49127.1 HAMP domain-containing histidine kinase [Flammeovirga sp. MY04]